MPASGGKKGAQRTKGNVKPSSSSQAAELLAQSGLGRTGFVGFGSSGSPAYVPASETFDDADNSLDSDFRMVLRKLSKRDSTTKIKALQEFAGLCQEKDEECLKGVLPFWPRIYNKMSIDVDHRVREATQQAMTTLVTRVRRNIAPYLKSMMGCWLLSQCDTYPTVATSASQAFQAAFPPAKQTGALEFCKIEITEYLVENLTTQTSLTLGDPKTHTAEEMETRYNRVVTSSFLALRKMMTSLPESSLASISGHIRGLLNDGKLWKHSKSTISGVKSGFYSFCAGLCQVMTDIAQDYSSKLSPLILHAIDTSDPVVVAAMWEAVLSLVKYLSESWNHVSWSKAFWPKLRTLLEKGCYGNASVIGPNLLPLMSQIPETLSGDPKLFYTELFSCFKIGMSLESVQQSGSESSALVAAFFECCQYAVKQLAGKKGEIIQILVLDHVLPVVESSLLENKSTLHKTPLYGMFAQLTGVLETTGQGKKVSSMCYQNLVQTIQETYPTMSNTPDFQIFSSRLISMVTGQVRPSAKIKTKSEKVKFADSVTVEDLSLENVELTGCSQEFVNTLLCYVFRKCFMEEDAEFLSVFSRMFSVYSSAETVDKLLTLSSCESGSNSYLTFMCKVIIPWLEKKQTTTDSILCLLDLVFVCLAQAGDAHSGQILVQLAQSLTSPVLLCHLIRKALDIHETMPSVTSWLKSSVLSDKIVSLSEEICTASMGETDEKDEILEEGWALITLVLSATHKDVSVFETSCIERTLGVILKTLQKLSSSSCKDRVDRAVIFVTKAAKMFFQNLKVFPSLDCVEDLLLALFSVHIDTEFPLSDKVRGLTHEALDCGLQVVVNQTGGYVRDGGFFERAAKLVQNIVSSRTQSLPVLEHTTKCVYQLLTTLQDNLTDASHTDPTIQTVVNSLFIIDKGDNYSEIEEYMTIEGMLSLTTLEKKRPTCSLPKLVFSTLFNTGLLAYKSTGEITLSVFENTSLQRDEITGVSWQEDDLKIMIGCLTKHTVSKCWAEYENKVSSFSDLASALDQLKVKVTKLVTNMDSKSQRKLLNLAMSRSDECGGVHAVSLSMLLDVLKSSQSEVILSDDAVIERCSSLSATTLHTLQCITSFVSDNAKLTAAEILNARFITTPADSSTEIDGGVGLLGVLNMTLPYLNTERSEVKDIYRSVMDQVIQWKQDTEDLMLFTCDLSESPLEKVSVNVEVMKFIQLYVSRLPQAMVDTEWDFVLCSTVAWVQTVVESEELLTSQTPVSVFSIVACQLLSDVVSCIDDRIRKSPSSFPENLISEWEEFFSEGVFSVLLPLYVRRVGRWLKTCGSGLHDSVLSSMGLAVSHCPKQHILNHQLPANLIAGQLSPLPDTLQSLLNTFCPMMLCSNGSVQVTGFHVLNSIVSDLPLYEKEDEEMEKVKDEDKRNDESSSPPEALNKVCIEGGAAMDIVLCDAGIEESHIVPPNTDEFKYAMGYLLSWKLILKLFKSSPSELRAKYAVYFKETGIVNHLLTHLYQLMPDNPTIPDKQATYFETHPPLLPSARLTALDVEHLSCSVYRQCLETIPALVRQWWMDQDKRTTSYIDKFTKKHVSPLLCHSEISSVQTTDQELDEIVIKARPKIREVIATYTMSEVSVEVAISLPENYPLGSITVVSDKKVGVTQSQWDRWLLHLNIFLQHQNGTIIEGLKLWKKNIDKRFEGVDDCMVCFSVLHGTNFQLPRLQCRTCKKKFHSACLYKWFSTSHNSTCPLCRNLF